MNTQHSNTNITNSLENQLIQASKQIAEMSEKISSQQQQLQNLKELLQQEQEAKEEIERDYIHILDVVEKLNDSEAEAI